MSADDARAEAQRRYQGDWDPYHGEPVDDAGFSEAERRAFVAGAEWAAGRAETTTDNLGGAYMLGYSAAKNAETTTATDEATVRAVGTEVEYRLRTIAAHYRSCGKHGTDPGNLIEREIADATVRLVGLLATARTRPTETEWAHRNASGGASVHRTREEAEAAREEHIQRRPAPVDEPPPPASLGIWRREVTPWRPDDEEVSR